MIDEHGAIHRLTRRLGAGGQGEVWLTDHGRRVVKLLPSGSAERVRRQIAFVKRCDLRELHVARPLALLAAPDVGYVAEFLADMLPIRSLLQLPRDAAVEDWYRGTGGLRRRLRLLAHTGEALAGIHAAGLAYGDLSHDNVFVSETMTASEAWLIDLDNLRHDSDVHSAIYTPGYGAPEVLTGDRGTSSLTDAWAFAVLAIHVLALTHPLCGDLVIDGEPELEEAALAGRLPWIEDSQNSTNACSRGLPRAMVLGRKLFEVARTTFEAGRLDPLARPTVATWADALHTAADQTLRCDRCASTFYASAIECPWCGADRPFAEVVRVHRWEPGFGVVQAMGTVAQHPLGDEPLVLTRRTTLSETGIRARRAHVTLHRRDRGLLVQADPGAVCWLSDADGPPGTGARPVDERGLIVPCGRDARWLVHFGQLTEPHRVARIGGPA